MTYSYGWERALNCMVHVVSAFLEKEGSHANHNTEQKKEAKK
jgi:hypothetical protein